MDKICSTHPPKKAGLSGFFAPLRSKKLQAAASLCFIFCCAGTACADDARVLPARVGRVSVVPNFNFAVASFDADWRYGRYTKDSKDGTLTAGNIGLGLEYGILNWITCSATWVPGWNFWSNVDAGSASPGELNINGVYDLFMGLSIQLLGPHAPLQSSRIRFLLAPLIKIPLPGADFDDESGKAAQGEAAIIANPDKHIFGFGTRASVDVIFHKRFFINFYGEYLSYPWGKNAADVSLADYGSMKNIDIGYGYDLTFELEPVLTLTPFEGSALSIGLPLNFTASPDLKYNAKTMPNTGTALLTLKPTVSLFIAGLFVPVEFKLSYAAPLTGRNVRALNTVSFLAKFYFKI